MFNVRMNRHWFIAVDKEYANSLFRYRLPNMFVKPFCTWRDQAWRIFTTEHESVRYPGIIELSALEIRWGQSLPNGGTYEDICSPKAHGHRTCFGSNKNSISSSSSNNNRSSNSRNPNFCHRPQTPTEAQSIRKNVGFCYLPLTECIWARIENA